MLNYQNLCLVLLAIGWCWDLSPYTDPHPVNPYCSYRCWENETHMYLPWKWRNTYTVIVQSLFGRESRTVIHGMQVGTIFYCNVFLDWRNYPPKLFFHYACGNSLKSKIAIIKEKKSFVQCCSSVQHILIVDDATPPDSFLFLTSHPFHHQQTVSHRLSLSAILMKWALVTLCTYSQAILLTC